ncbi:EipA family protein [Hyphomicrobium sp.]|uniref:DUF1134 domain-containing protein n=1 Tax=Hyphomicrobium sp. TaxID=82 RepID=UPI003F717E9C
MGLSLALALALVPAAAVAQTCSVESFGEAVDTSAAELRKFSAETQPQLKQKLQALRSHKQWDESDFETRGLALVHDKKLDAFDAQAGELLSKIDTLGSPEPADPSANLSCANLSELKAASSELMSVMRAKSAYLISKIDREITSTPAGKPTEVAKVETTTPPAEPAPPRSYSSPAGESMVPPNEDALSPLRRADPQKKTEPPKKADAPASTPIPPEAAAPAPTPSAPTASAQKTEKPSPPAEPKSPAASALAEPLRPETANPPARAAETPPHEHVPPAAPKAKDDERETTSSWSTTTAQAVIPPPPLPHQSQPSGPPNYNAPPPGAPYSLPPSSEPGELDPNGEAFDAEGGGYSIDEIREATRGFFGTVSTSLASVIEHAFQKGGRPTAYVLGNEGGGAFLAGLRYGEGTLYVRSGGSQKVYWHGPSIGYDMGAEGSRTLFLIYGLDDPANLFRRYTGVDGSAYLVGGVGMTLLKGGPVTMAPIRSGIGLRLGASIGYVRFSQKPTWNPF